MADGVRYPGLAYYTTALVIGERYCFHAGRIKDRSKGWSGHATRLPLSRPGE